LEIEEKNPKFCHQNRYPYDENGKLKVDASLYTDDLDKVVANHPLKIMVECKRLSLLKNPVVAYLIRHKWNSVGRYIYYTDLGIYSLFLLLLTHYITERSMPNDNIDKYDTENVYEKRFILILFNLLIYFLTYLTDLLNFLLCYCFQDVKWIVGGFAVFIAWINLLFMIRKLPKFGIYILMFFDVVSTFLQSVVVFGLFVVAFSMLFFIWLQNREEFKTRWLSVMKTTMMMVGEVDYVTMFFDNDGSMNKQPNPWANIALFAFVIIMTILLMNLLVGLAVDDIKAVQEKAELTRIAMHVSCTEQYPGCSRITQFVALYNRKHC
uniref:Ion_trans domain-containing protein n=1 Tax=Syphacia muris TaxID=451379 RepID=A0A0N5AX88_9BILA